MPVFLPIVSRFDEAGLKQAREGISGLESVFKKVGGLVAGAFAVGAVKNFASESITAAEGVAVADNRILSIAESMGLFGGNADVAASRIAAFAESNEMLLGVDAELLKAGQAQLLTFKDVASSADEAGGVFDRATIAAADLAAAGFGTVDSASVQLGKALQDPIKGISALARSGVTFSEDQKAMIKSLVESGDLLGAQEIILGAVEQQVGGTSAATVTASEKMSLAFGNLQETVGAALMPAFATLAATMVPIAEKVAPALATAIEGLIPFFETLIGAIPMLVDAFLPLLEPITLLVGAFLQLVSAVLPLFVELIGAIVPLIASLVPPFIELVSAVLEPLIPVLQEVFAAFMPLLTQVFQALAPVLGLIIPLFAEMVQALLPALVPILGAVISAFGPLLEAILPALEIILRSVVIPALEAMSQVIQFVVPLAVGIMTTAFTAFGDFISGLSTTFETVWTNISDFFKGVVNSMIGTAEGLANGVIDVVNGIISAINGLKIDVPQWVTDLTGIKDFGFNIPKLSRIKIPRLAEGGIVMPQPGGVIAQLAEAGQAEAVIPLDRLGNMGGNNYSITINAGVGSDPVAIGRYVTEAIKKYERVSGKVFANA